MTRAIARAIERTPDPFADWHEPRLRDLLLVMLNSHYEGKAAGEVFQRAGKIDIAVRIEDANVFLGECEWWGGPASFNDAVDQLFSYTAWRDTKLALVVFVREKGFSAIIEKARAELAAHEGFVA